MTKTTARILSACLLFLVLHACEKKQHGDFFTVEGNITGAEGMTLYMENGARQKLDSTVLNSAGQFRFTSPKPANTDFYQLRLERQIIHFVADSTENISINGDAINLVDNYTITGSAENMKIKELSQLQQSTLKEYRRYQTDHNNKAISDDDYALHVTVLIGDYKTRARQYMTDFASPSTYFALFQQVDNLFIFDPYDKEDLKLFGAVANNHPDSIRREQVKNIYLNGLTVLRGEQEREFDLTETSGSEMFDISLPTVGGKKVSLSDIGKGKLTLIDFTVYAAPESPGHNIMLAEVYNKYKNKGFEIYQVSLDHDEHLWLNASDNLPWIKVRDPESIYSQNLVKYNVTGLPTGYLRDKDGEIVERVEDYNDLDALIRKHLK